MKVNLYVIGVGLIVGALAVATYLFLNNKTKKECNVCSDCKKPESKDASEKDASLTHAIVQEELMCDDVKSSVIGSMYARHEDAASVIKESVDTIRKNVKISQDTDNEIDQISNELDKMLSED